MLRYQEQVRLLNQSLELAGRVADYLEFAELIVTDALYRKESCGCHFRRESQNDAELPQRDDQKFSYIAAWQFNGSGKEEILHKDPLTFEEIALEERNYQ